MHTDRSIRAEPRAARQRLEVSWDQTVHQHVRP